MSGDYDFGKAFIVLGVMCAVGGGVAVSAVWGLTSVFSSKTEAPLVSLSAGRQQLLKEGFVGSSREFQNFLATQANEYFRQKGYPCDPQISSSAVATTVARAQCSLPAPDKR